MPRLAIVISAVGSVESLESTLVSVLENRPADSEILVALRQPYADPYELKEEVRFILPTPRATTPVAAINAALAATRAPFVHILASGCSVTEGWADAALSRFGDRRVASVVPWLIDADRPQRLFAAGIGYRTRGQRYRVGRDASADTFEPSAAILGPALCAGFYRKGALDLVGGFSGQLGVCQADADLAMALRHAGLTTAVEPRSRVMATASVEPQGSAFVDALAEERLFWRQPAGMHASVLLSHLLLAAWDVVGTLPRPQTAARLAGRVWAALELGTHARHRQRLAALAARAIPPAGIDGHTRIDASHEAPGRRETAPARARAS